MRIVKLIAVVFGILLAAVIIVPLVVLAGLFVWLKLTEEADDELLEFEQELEEAANEMAEAAADAAD